MQNHFKFRQNSPISLIFNSLVLCPHAPHESGPNIIQSYITHFSFQSTSPSCSPWIWSQNNSITYHPFFLPHTSYPTVKLYFSKEVCFMLHLSISTKSSSCSWKARLGHWQTVFLPTFGAFFFLPPLMLLLLTTICIWNRDFSYFPWSLRCNWLLWFA